MESGQVEYGFPDVVSGLIVPVLALTPPSTVLRWNRHTFIELGALYRGALTGWTRSNDD